MMNARHSESQPVIRWGIASTGKIAGKMATALGELPGAEIVAVGSRGQSSAEAFATRFGIPSAHESYEQLYLDPDVDVVYVASPHPFHHPMTLAALDAGKHVLCEKPLALNASQAREMIDAAARNERFLMEAMWSWFIPALTEVRDLVAAGAIGEVKVVEANFGLPIHDPAGRHRHPELGGGALLDLGIYPLAIARLILGEPSAVRALGVVDERHIDTLLGGVLSFPSGAISVFHTTVDTGSDHTARILGTGGHIVIEAPFWHASAYRIARGDDDPERVVVPNRGLAHEAAHTMHRIRDGHLESDVVSWASSLASMELLDEIRRQVGVVYPGEE